MPHKHDCWATRDWARGGSHWAWGRPTDEDRGRRQAVSEAAAWERDGGADESEPTDQSESWGSWEDAARVYERDGRAAWDPDRLDNRHQSESTETTDPGDRWAAWGTDGWDNLDRTETTDPGGSPSTWTSDIASTGGPSAGWSSSQHAWPAWKSAGWVERSEGSRTQDRKDMQALSETSLVSKLDERLTATVRELLSLQALVGDLVNKVDNLGRCVSTRLQDAENSDSSVPPQPVQQGASRPPTCAHVACNVTHDQVAQLENQFVVNAILVENITELHAMISHLQDTVLDQNGELVTAFYKMFTRFISRFKIQYCRASANRFLLIECRICGCAFYGKYARGYKEDIAEFITDLAAFLNVQIQPGATQV